MVIGSPIISTTKKARKKNKRHFRHFFCLYVARPQISDSHFYVGSDHQETQSPINQEPKTKPHYQQYCGKGLYVLNAKKISGGHSQ